jgi:16S rRNA (cytosine1402-N4)-methyltransferase
MNAAREHYIPKTTSHVPVLVNEVVEYMAPKEGEIYVDGTFGAGGYSRALLGAAKCKVFGIDRDPYVEVFVQKISDEFAERFSFSPGRFGELDQILKGEGLDQVNGVVLDVGVSSMQLETPRRGFSFMQDGPLDMRMESEGSTAADFVNNAQEEELAGVLFKYGGERFSRKIARAIVTARSESEITRTGQLADIVRRAVRAYNDTIDPATRTFQALRIWVNDELGELSRALEAAERVLAPGGRLVIVSFHSEEDGIVKQFLKERSGRTEGVSRHQIVPQATPVPPTFSLLTPKGVKASSQEVAANPRSRSARLRAATRTSAAARLQKGRVK